jgi:serine/threonine protein kinase
MLYVYIICIKQFSFDASQKLDGLKQGAMKEADLLTLSPDHKNIVRCFGSWLQNNTSYTKIEYLVGMDLFDFYQANCRNISQPVLLSIIIDTLSGISHLHKHDIMHRDLKPENLFRTKSGTTKVIDLGLGKLLSNEFTNSSVGTPAYLSPEQVNKDSSGYSKKHDLHQLAVIYFILAAGYHPFFVADNDPERMKKTFENIRNKPLHLQRSDRVPYDQRILDLINKLGAKDPAKRPTAQEALDEALAIDEAIKAEHAEELLENNVQAIVNEQNARRANAIRVSALVANYFLENARKRTMARLVNKLKKSTRFKNIQLEERLRDLTLANERERTEKEKLKREKDEADKKRNDALKMLKAKEQETLNAGKKKLEDERKCFEEQQAEQRRQLQKQEARFEAMMKAKEREIVENKHRIYKDNWVRDGILNPKLLVIQKFWKQKVVEVQLHHVKLFCIVVPLVLFEPDFEF